MYDLETNESSGQQGVMSTWQTAVNIKSPHILRQSFKIFDIFRQISINSGFRWIPTYSSQYLEYSDEFVLISYLDQMPNNKKGLAYSGKRPDNYSKYVYEMRTNVLKNSIRR